MLCCTFVRNSLSIPTFFKCFSLAISACAGLLALCSKSWIFIMRFCWHRVSLCCCLAAALSTALSVRLCAVACASLAALSLASVCSVRSSSRARLSSASLLAASSCFLTMSSSVLKSSSALLWAAASFRSLHLRFWSAALSDLSLLLESMRFRASWTACSFCSIFSWPRWNSSAARWAHRSLLISHVELDVESTGGRLPCVWLSSPPDSAMSSRRLLQPVSSRFPTGVESLRDLWLKSLLGFWTSLPPCDLRALLLTDRSPSSSAERRPELPSSSFRRCASVRRSFSASNCRQRSIVPA
mmetsp:Transcript_4398/g.12862  ORF Transcript_4398/g.12862 Transcript_4398/m.12862 type:complete len:299 (+) Transcript_4398:520-1416(+)